jgi:hypothetical protein
VAKRATTEPPAPGAGTQPAEQTSAGETLSGYFRRIFKENPKLLKERSNEALYRRWREDHPGPDEIPQAVKTAVQNVKNDLRRKLAERKAARRAEVRGQPPDQSQGPQPPRRSPAKDLQRPEHEIDECLTLARGLDREVLRGVIGILREARNAVVRKQGEGRT